MFVLKLKCVDWAQTVKISSINRGDDISEYVQDIANNTSINSSVN